MDMDYVQIINEFGELKEKFCTQEVKNAYYIELSHLYNQLNDDILELETYVVSRTNPVCISDLESLYSDLFSFRVRLLTVLGYFNAFPS